MKLDMFLMTLDKKGKVVVVSYPAKLNATHTDRKVWDKMILDKKVKGLKV